MTISSILTEERKREIVMTRLTALHEQYYESSIIAAGLQQQTGADPAAIEQTRRILDALEAQITVAQQELDRISGSPSEAVAEGR